MNCRFGLNCRNEDHRDPHIVETPPPPPRCNSAFKNFDWTHAGQLHVESVFEILRQYVSQKLGLYPTNFRLESFPKSDVYASRVSYQARESLLASTVKEIRPGDRTAGVQGERNPSRTAAVLLEQQTSQKSGGGPAEEVGGEDPVGGGKGAEVVYGGGRGSSSASVGGRGAGSRPVTFKLPDGSVQWGIFVDNLTKVPAAQLFSPRRNGKMLFYGEKDEDRAAPVDGGGARKISFEMQDMSRNRDIFAEGAVAEAANKPSSPSRAKKSQSRPKNVVHISPNETQYPAVVEMETHKDPPANSTTLPRPQLLDDEEPRWALPPKPSTDALGRCRLQQERSKRANYLHEAVVLSQHLVLPTYSGPLALFTDYQLHEKKGEGAFGSVLLCEHRRTGILRACKSIRLRSRSQAALVQNEINVLKKLDHPNIVRLLEAYDDEDVHMYLVFELCQGGSLFDRLLYHGRVLKVAMSEAQACR